MTLPPIDGSFTTQAVEGPRYTVGPRCANPLCSRLADHAHHIFRRSAVGRSNWVRLPDGKVVGNLTGLCVRCHGLVTGDIGGHVAAIRYVDGIFYWAHVLREGEKLLYRLTDPIQPQPPDVEDTEPFDAETVCSHCGHVRRKKKMREPARPRKTWTVQVPKDDEDGAQVLDDYVDALVPIFRLDPDGGAMTRYHVLTRALAFTLVNRDHIPDEGKVAQ